MMNEDDEVQAAELARLESLIELIIVFRRGVRMPIGVVPL